MNRGKQGGPTKDSRWWEARRDREVKQFRMESWKRIGQFGKRPKNSSRKTESRKLARKLGSLSVFRGRPPGYEKYEIWFSRVVNGYTALYVYMCVCVCVYIYIYLSLVLRPGFPLGFISFSVSSLHMRIVGGSRGSFVRACSRTLSIEKRANRS